MSTLFDRMNDEGGIIAPVGLTSDQEKSFWSEFDDNSTFFEKIKRNLESNIDKVEDKDWYKANFLEPREKYRSKKQEIFVKYQKIAEENKKRGFV